MSGKLRGNLPQPRGLPTEISSLPSALVRRIIEAACVAGGMPPGTRRWLRAKQEFHPRKKPDEMSRPPSAFSNAPSALPQQSSDRKCVVMQDWYPPSVVSYHLPPPRHEAQLPPINVRYEVLKWATRVKSRPYLYIATHWAFQSDSPNPAASMTFRQKMRMFSADRLVLTYHPLGNLFEPYGNSMSERCEGNLRLMAGN